MQPIPSERFPFEEPAGKSFVDPDVQSHHSPSETRLGDPAEQSPALQPQNPAEEMMYASG